MKWKISISFTVYLLSLSCLYGTSHHVGILWSEESEVTQSCLTLCDPMGCSPPGSSVHGILQARILEWVAIFYSRRSSWPRDWTHVSCIGKWILYCWATREVFGTLSKSFNVLEWVILWQWCFRNPSLVWVRPQPGRHEKQRSQLEVVWGRGSQAVSKGKRVKGLSE